MKPIIEIHRLGRIPYIRALGFQQALFDKLRSDQHQASTLNGSSAGSARNSLLLLEHEPVYTVGIRSQQYNCDYVDKLKDTLAQHKLRAEFVQTNRGGLITFHGPGQLVAYPIIRLGDFSKSIPNKSVKAYVKRLEDTIIDTLSRLGLDGAHTLREFPGVWMGGGERKIAFVGITCKRYVTMHGISINCDCDLTWFEHIVSCGIEGKAITSVRQELLSRSCMVTSDSRMDRRVDSLPEPDRSQSAAVTSDNWSPISLWKSNRSGSVVNDRDHECGIQRVADAFCLSFSQQFECELLER